MGINLEFKDVIMKPEESFGGEAGYCPWCDEPLVVYHTYSPIVKCAKCHKLVRVN